MALQLQCLGLGVFRARLSANMKSTSKLRAPAATFVVVLLLAFQNQPTNLASEDDTSSDTVRAKEILARSLRAIADVKDYAGTMRTRERFGNRIVSKTLAYKFARPFKVYIKYVKPHAGREAIYVRGWNNNEIRVHKGSFPDITINPAPLSDRAMEDTHHPILTFGLENMTRISAQNIRKGIRLDSVRVKVSDGGILFGHPVWVVEAWFPKGGRYMKAKKRETLWEIAMRTGQNMFVIMHHNDAYDEPDNVKAGDSVFIPRHYAGRVEYFVAKDTWIMIKATSWDHAGRLFESYEYPKLNLNPGLTDLDFDPDNPNYDF